MNKHHYMFPLIAAVLVIIAIVWHSLSPDNAIKPQGEPVNPTPAIATATATAGPSEGTPSITATYSPAPDNSPVPSDASSAALRVNVRSRYKVPLAGANVEIHVRLLIPLPVPSSPLAKSTTGEDGQAQLIIPGKGLFILMVSAPGHATHLSHISLETSDKAREITVNLAAAAVLKGSLRTKDNLPVAGVTVGPLINDDTTIREYPVFPFFSRTDETGKFAFDGITPGLYRLQVTVPGYQSAVRDGITIPGNDLDFILEDGGFSASGVTAGARDGTPIPDVGIMLAGEGIFLLHTTGLDGIFRFENLSPGKYYIEPIR
ncbi:MAG TPA: carboxypeptidase regulatory-like domain-containing protein, partial [Candidatus Sumerlaeota bacterium]|nr:carboxypeptidase regulatory-like domain-containing protein [Candidatus Sumerlaeota bacterium]